MTIHPYNSTEEDGPNYGPILSNHIFPASLVRLRESKKRMSTLQKIARETSGFHMEAARRHGVSSSRGLAHFRAAKAYREADSKLLEYFENGGQSPDQQAQINPKAQMEAHAEAVKFHKKMAEKHGLNSDQGHAHVALMEKHMDAARGIKQKAKQQKSEQLQNQKPAPNAAGGAAGRQAPVPVPKKSQQKNPDIRQNKPPVPLNQLQQKEAKSGGKSKFVAQRYDKSHPEGFQAQGSQPSDHPDFYRQ